MLTIKLDGGYDAYVYLEDRNDFSTIRQRNWDRSTENANFSRDSMCVLKPTIKNKTFVEIEFAHNLWITAMEAIGMKWEKNFSRRIDKSKNTYSNLI